ncbi:hypothetical protein EZS27_005858 [termite gut metagenome]|uniref:Lipoprotein n=1 Tax=termite gut metagenome TaxID=433724 RepID=A0A5J4SMM8_9ZZZZ
MKKNLRLLLLVCIISLSFSSCQNDRDENELTYDFNLQGSIIAKGDTTRISSHYTEHTCDALAFAIHNCDSYSIEKEIIHLFNCQTYNLLIEGQIQGFPIKERFHAGFSIGLIDWEEKRYTVTW